LRLASATYHVLFRWRAGDYRLPFCSVCSDDYILHSLPPPTISWAVTYLMILPFYLPTIPVVPAIPYHSTVRPVPTVPILHHHVLRYVLRSVEFDFLSWVCCCCSCSAVSCAVLTWSRFLHTTTYLSFYKITTWEFYLLGWVCCTVAVFCVSGLPALPTVTFCSTFTTTASIPFSATSFLGACSAECHFWAFCLISACLHHLPVLTTAFRFYWNFCSLLERLPGCTTATTTCRFPAG